MNVYGRGRATVLGPDISVEDVLEHGSLGKINMVVPLRGKVSSKEHVREKLHRYLQKREPPADVDGGRDEMLREFMVRKQAGKLDPCVWKTDASSGQSYSIKASQDRKKFVIHMVSEFPLAFQVFKQTVRDSGIKTVGDLVESSVLRNYMDLVKRNALACCYRISTDAGIPIDHSYDNEYRDYTKASHKVAVPTHIHHITMLHRPSTSAKDDAERSIEYYNEFAPCEKGKGIIFGTDVAHPMCVFELKPEADPKTELVKSMAHYRWKNEKHRAVVSAAISAAIDNRGPEKVTIKKQFRYPTTYIKTSFALTKDGDLEHYESLHKGREFSAVAGCDKKIKYREHRAVGNKNHYNDDHVKGIVSLCPFSKCVDMDSFKHYKLVSLLK